MMKDSKSPSYHLPWILLIILFPLIGIFLYLISCTNLFQNKKIKNVNKNIKEEKKYFIQNNNIQKEIDHKELMNLKYIYQFTKYPVTNNNDIKYYSLGELQYEDILIELKKAKNFIFMEFYMIHLSKMWNEILDILEQKVKNNVKVRIIYDDMGSSSKLPKNYPKILAKKGMKCIKFNPIKLFGSIMKNRDHRKIVVIDGLVAFSGGMNLSDEYINIDSKLGHWKDTGIKIKGDAVWSYTVMFLSIWNAYTKEDKDFTQYKVEHIDKNIKNGYVAVYGENPLDNEVIGEDIYLNIIHQAKEYIYIETPYLVIDSNIMNSLTLAAKNGVDVRIIVPGVPDNKIVYELTCSYFETLIRGGVKIYTYTPGFMHSKLFIVDDKRVAIGSINLDYRSLYLHFECGIYMENINVIKEIKKDVEQSIKSSHQVMLEETKVHAIKYLWHLILRFFSPTM